MVAITRIDAVALVADVAIAATFVLRKPSPRVPGWLLLLAYAIFFPLNLGRGRLSSVDPALDLDPYAIMGIALVGVGLFFGTFGAKDEAPSLIKATAAGNFALSILALVSVGASLAGYPGFAWTMLYVTGGVFLLFVVALIVAAIRELLITARDLTTDKNSRSRRVRVGFRGRLGMSVARSRRSRSV